MVNTLKPMELLDINIVNRINKEAKKEIQRLKKQPFIKKKVTPTKQNRIYSRIPKSYNTYIKSHWWLDRRNKYFKNNHRKCVVCGSCNYIQLHHKLYADFGFEKDENLVALCGFHHQQIHSAIGKTKKNMITETNNYIDEMKKYQKVIFEQILGQDVTLSVF